MNIYQGVGHAVVLWTLCNISASYAQSNPLEAVPQVLTPVTQTVQPLVRKPIQPLAQTVTQTSQQIVATVEQGLDALPKVWPLLSAQQQPVWQEIEYQPGVRAVAQEWVMLLNTPAEEAVVWTALASLGAERLESTRLSQLQLQYLRFRVPAAVDSMAALQAKLPPSVHELLERHYLYTVQGHESSTNSDKPAVVTSPMPLCEPSQPLGLVDTAVALEHPALVGAKISQQFFLPAELTPTTAHGSAVAGILVGQAPSLAPLIPTATLKVAVAFYPRAQAVAGASLLNLVQALNWFASQQVPVVNLSLTGPSHPLLQRAISQLAARGVTLVAAAGNNGPHASAAYPAAYSDVIAVSAVDAKHRIYRWANQGEYVEAAALGVSVTTVRPQGLGRESGTSLASPVIAAALLCALEQGVAPEQLRQWLQLQLIDLGVPGRDSVFGGGLYLRPH